jgi:hypothetical protein
MIVLPIPGAKEATVNLTKQEVDAKLITLGERMLEQALYRKQESVRKRAIVTVVQQHIRASASELKERLMEVFDKPLDATPADREAMLTKLVR